MPPAPLPGYLVRTFTADGLRLDGFLAPAEGSSLGESPGLRPPAFSVLALHGVGANFYNSTALEALLPALRGLGGELLLANTRGHDLAYTGHLGTARRRLGAAYETVDECRLDVAGWLRFFREQSRRKVVLLGHSLGAIKAVYSQAHEPAEDVAAVVAVSPPRLSHLAFVNAANNGDYLASLREAQALAGSGQGEQLFTARYPFPLLITAAGYLDKYGPGERYDIVQQAPRLPMPALFVYGERELAEGSAAFTGVPAALAAQPQAGRREIITIPGADHVYSGCTAKLAEAVAGWLRERVL